MKKSFLFKWVSVLGVVLLLANVVLPWINAYAYSDETWMWDYVRNEETWNNSATNWSLQVYYANNPSEDLWCGDHKASFNDIEYAAQICTDSECSDATDVDLTTTWGDTYQTISDWTNSYLLTMSAEAGSDEIYELYNVIVPTCTIPDGVEGADFPSGWDSPEVCEYRVLFPATDGKCLSGAPEWAPAGAYVPDWARNIDGSSNHDWPDSNGKCLYKAAAIPPSTQPTPSGKYVKLLSSSYPDCAPSYSGALANGAKYPWISIAFNQEFKWVIKFNYSGYQDGADVYPRWEWIKIWWPVWKARWEASIPEEFGDEYLVNSGTTTFDLDKFSATLIPARTLTIHYVYDNWGEAATDYTWLFLDWEEYNQASPGIANYTVDIATVTWTITEDVEITVTYTPTPSSNKSSWWGGGSSKTTKADDSKAETSSQDSNSTDNNIQTNEDENWIDNDGDMDSQNAWEEKYNQEFHDAYDFAFKNGITTMPSIAEADMNGTLTRIAMAKMLSQYAINVLGKTPDTGKNISFPDVSPELDAQYNSWVTLSYQLGIMWINIEKFRPFDNVTRAEFVTALSRLLFWTADGENLYYETHMQKLLEEKIITVADPDMKELRWYVMIMLMRSADK